MRPVLLVPQIGEPMLKIWGGGVVGMIRLDSDTLDAVTGNSERCDLRVFRPSNDFQVVFGMRLPIYREDERVILRTTCGCQRQVTTAAACDAFHVPIGHNGMRSFSRTDKTENGCAIFEEDA